jgi:hypothetical protein
MVRPFALIAAPLGSRGTLGRVPWANAVAADPIPAQTGRPGHCSRLRVILSSNIFAHPEAVNAARFKSKF